MGDLRLVSQSSLGQADSSASLSDLERDHMKLGVEGWASLSAGIGSRRMMREQLQDQIPVDGDSHLVEFSEALRSVAKALRQVSEGKARAQNEAAAWKQKYELEVIRSKRIGHRPVGNVCPGNVRSDESTCMAATSSAEQRDSGSQYDIDSPHNGSSRSCATEGICCQHVIREQGPSSSVLEAKNNSDKKIGSDKVLFRLAWGSNLETNRRHKHDVVSFESGNITTAVCSSKQITLKWDSPPKSVFILTKPASNSVAALCKEMVRWLHEAKSMHVFVEPNVKKDLLEDSSDFSSVQTCTTGTDVLDLHKKVDLVITLGGDGTVLWAANMFKGPVPPLVSFSMGSLGFMTQFQSDRYRECLETIMKGPVYITLRHRLHCRIIRSKENVEDGSEEDGEDYLVLNEVSIDRGMSAYLTNLECYCDNLFVTSVQGDGLILSTPSGSTAYSLAAGGSMVHPQVPGILFTPICPHSLSFRPLILPEYVNLRVQIPINSRGQAWASFDGKERQKLTAGDALVVHMSAWPVPAVCDEESTNDFLRSVREGLHWNLRKSQSDDGPRDIQTA